MSVSLAQALTVDCARCHATFSLDVWLIVDTRERPDLASAAAEGTLNRFVCPGCGSVGRTSTPLLLYRAGDPEPLVFSPSPSSDRDTGQALLDQLVRILLARLGDAGRGGELGSPNPHRDPSGPILISAADAAHDFIRRYHHSRQHGDIDVAVFAADEAVDLAGDHAEECAHAKALLGWALLERYGDSGDADDLERGLCALEAARDLAPNAGDTRSRVLFLLGNAYSARHGSNLKRAGDLDDAIAMYRAAAAELPAATDAITCRLN